MHDATQAGCSFIRISGVNSAMLHVFVCSDAHKVGHYINSKGAGTANESALLHATGARESMHVHSLLCVPILVPRARR